MKAERDSPLALCAAMIIDPIQSPAAFITPNGRVFHANTRWQQWERNAPQELLSATDELTRLAQDLAVPFDSGHFDDFAAHQYPLSSDYCLSVKPFRGVDRWMRGLIAYIDRAPASACLTDAELERWRYVLGTKHQGVWDLDLLTGNNYFSDGWSTLRGYPADDPPSGAYTDWIDRIHPDDRESIERRRFEFTTTDTNELLQEYRERGVDGHWIWVMSHNVIVSRDENGTPTRVIGTDTNVSHLRIGTDADQEMNKRLQLAIGASNIGIWEYDFANDNVSWDQRTRALYGVDDPRLHWPGSIWGDFLHPDDRETTVSMTDQAIAEMSDLNITFRIIRRDGAIRSLRSRASHVVTHTGAPKLVGITWDVTAEVEREQEVKAAYAMIRERNAALEKAHAELEHQSTHDALTGIANRRQLDRFQHRMFANGTEAGQRCAVLQIDVDRFKAINDTLGHAAGDYVLKQAARILTDAAPPGALVARVGGDEFAVLLAHAPNDSMVGHWANEIIAQAKRPISYNGHVLRFSVSIGIASGTSTANDIDQLFSQADLALYDAKRIGRGVARFFVPDLQSAAEEMRKGCDDILAALETTQFCCHYQPQYDASGTVITGVEALARWNHPTRGLLTPDKFLSLSEELGVIAQIDELVLKAALADAKAWSEAGKVCPRIFVNVSGQRLLDPLLPDRLAFLQDSPIPIGFELLETVFLDQTDPHLDSNLARLRDLKIAIDVDDFGSGHASILCLRNLRPDRIKIDRQLISQATEDPEQRALIRAIVEIGRVMGMSVVAEGVETQNHIATLQDLGCHFLQGYGLCRPIPAEQMLEILPNG